MKRYEVIREIYNTCAGKYNIDGGFIDEVETEDTDKEIELWFKGLAKYEKETAPDGSVIYNMTEPQIQRITFSEF